MKNLLSKQVEKWESSESVGGRRLKFQSKIRDVRRDRQEEESESLLGLEI